MARNSDKTYQLWKRCRARCRSNFHQSKDYYEKDIKFNFSDDYLEFKEYVEALPNFGKEGYSLDRIDNDGNYEFGNLRWTTRTIQNVNQGLKHNNKTGYKDIHVRKNGNYRAKVVYNGRRLFDKTFKTLEEAVEARKEFITLNNLPHLL
jgi:hypothetical protein